MTKDENHSQSKFPSYYHFSRSLGKIKSGTFEYKSIVMF